MKDFLIQNGYYPDLLSIGLGHEIVALVQTPKEAAIQEREAYDYTARR